MVAERKYVSMNVGHDIASSRSGRNGSFFQEYELLSEEDRPQLEPIRHQPL